MGNATSATANSAAAGVTPGTANPAAAPGKTAAATPAAASGTNSGNTGANAGTGNNASNTGDNSNDTPSLFETPEFKRFLQSEIDRATNKIGNENKTLKEALESLQKSKLTESELKDLQIKQREADIEQREAALKAEKNRMYAMTAIKTAGLDDGTNTALDLIDLVMADEESAIDAKVKALNTLVNKMVTTQVDKTFKEHGRVPNKGTGETKSKNLGVQVAETIGKKNAESNAKAREVLDYYTGGKK